MATEAKENYAIEVGGWCCLRCGATVGYNRQKLHDRWHQRQGTPIIAFGSASSLEVMPDPYQQASGREGSDD